MFRPVELQKDKQVQLSSSCFNLCKTHAKRTVNVAPVVYGFRHKDYIIEREVCGLDVCVPESGP